MKWCLSTASAGALLAAAAAHAQALPNQPVAALDLARYAGLWHEIAHLPLVFQRQCASDITAEYTVTQDGQIRVRNACRTREGSLDTATGVARMVRPGPEGALQVRFAPDWLRWLPWVWADYWVIEIDPGYQWAVVGSPSRRYLWVLSRSADMSRAQFDAIRSRATLRGYALDELRVDAPLR